jgi:hypothetical protein
MEPIEHTVAPIKQKTSECMQTATTQLISFYNPAIKLEDVLREVPVYVENGEKIGTSPGHLAAYLAKNYKTVVYIFDTELFDRSWHDLSPEQVIKQLKKRQKYIPANAWLAKYHHILVDGWELFATAGGRFRFIPITIKLLRELLDDGPYLMMVNSTYLNEQAKQHYSKVADKFVPDPIKGRSLTHAVTCAGYKDGKFLIIDPDPPRGVQQKRWVAEDHILASVMAAQTESDNLLMKVTTL